MTSTAATPNHPALDRAAAMILGSMITLIAALGFVLVEISIESSAEPLPVAASASGSPATP